MEKVLVLMASYNGGKYIDQQIESLFAQEGVEVELLVRDDGSSDDTCARLDAWAEKTNTRWYTGPHLNVQFGFYDLMVKAMESDAKYYAFCDQDDVWDMDKLSAGVALLQTVAEGQPGLYYCGQRLVDANLNHLSDHSLNRHRSPHARFVLNDMAGCTAVFNRALLEKMTAYRPAYIRMHDVWMTKVCLGLGGQIFPDPDTHMAYRQHGNNVIGLSGGLKSKLRRAKMIIFESSIYRQAEQLLAGYEQELLPEYRALIADILASKKSLPARIRLLRKHNIHFHDKGLSLTFALKVLLGKI